MAVGGSIGILSAFLQTVEKITLLENKDAVLACNLNSVFSCSSVLQAWQSSIFGFPNSLMCLVLFTIFTTTAMVGATGGKLSKRMRLGVQYVSLATLGFAIWFIWQSIFVISAICIFCMFCLLGLLIVNWAWLRINADILPIGIDARKKLGIGIEKGTDIFGWMTLALIVIFAMILRFL